MNTVCFKLIFLRNVFFELCSAIKFIFLFSVFSTFILSHILLIVFVAASTVSIFISLASFIFNVYNGYPEQMLMTLIYLIYSSLCFCFVSIASAVLILMSEKILKYFKFNF